MQTKSLPCRKSLQSSIFNVCCTKCAVRHNYPQRRITVPIEENLNYSSTILGTTTFGIAFVQLKHIFAFSADRIQTQSNVRLKSIQFIFQPALHSYIHYPLSFIEHIPKVNSNKIRHVLCIGIQLDGFCLRLFVLYTMIRLCAIRFYECSAESQSPQFPMQSDIDNNSSKAAIPSCPCTYYVCFKLLHKLYVYCHKN